LAKQTLSYDSQTDWETGDMSGLIAVDPAGKLSLGTDLEKIASYRIDGSLAVYCRLSEGMGTTIANLGSAGSGTLIYGNWEEREDGRHYLSNGQVQVPYHSSMAVKPTIGDNPQSYLMAAGLRVRVSSLGAQVLMQRDNRFSLGIDVSGYPYARYLATDGWKIAKSSSKLEVNKWYVLSIGGTGSSVTLYQDGSIKARTVGFESKADPYSGALIVTCNGDFTDFAYSGDGTSVDELVRQSTSGVWEKKIDLGEDDWTLQYVTMLSAKDVHEHSISMTVTFADTEDEIPFAEDWKFSCEGGEELLVPPEEGLIHGHWIGIQVRMSAMSWDRVLPLVEELNVALRTTAPVLGEYEDDEYVGEEGLEEEPQKPENIEAALKAIKDLKVNLIELNRKSSSLGEDIGSLDTRLTAVEDEQEEIDPAFLKWLYGYEIPDSLANLRRDFESHKELVMQAITDVAMNLALLGSRIYDVEDKVDVPGYLAWTDQSEQRQVGVRVVYLLSLALQDDGLIDDAIKENIATHAALVTGVHGALGADLATEQDVANAVSAHAELRTGAHGAEVGDRIALFSDITDEINAHAVLKRNIHGVGASDIACMQDILTHAAITTGVHGAAIGDKVGKPAVDDHAVLITEVHGLGYGEYFMASYGENQIGATELYVNDAISYHQNLCANFSVEF
jgi:hypothetical protein